jgi:hypothetical protein
MIPRVRQTLRENPMGEILEEESYGQASEFRAADGAWDDRKVTCLAEATGGRVILREERHGGPWKSAWINGRKGVGRGRGRRVLAEGVRAMNGNSDGHEACLSAQEQGWRQRVGCLAEGGTGCSME